MKALILSLLLSLLFSLTGWAAELSADEWDKRIVLRGGLMAYDMSGDFSSTRDGRPKVEVDMDEIGLDENLKTYFLGATINSFTTDFAFHLRRPSDRICGIINKT